MKKNINQGEEIMEETNENKEVIVFEITSKEDAIQFKSIASGRKFCKKGNRLTDICENEIEKYEYKKLGLFTRIFKHRKFKKKQENLLLEDRISSNIRNIAIKFINDGIVNKEELVNKVKETILEKVTQYSTKNK